LSEARAKTARESAASPQYFSRATAAIASGKIQIWDEGRFGERHARFLGG
jgi:hypothetical protein